MKASMKSAKPWPFPLSSVVIGLSRFGCALSSLASARVDASMCVDLFTGFSFREMGWWNFPFYKGGEPHPIWPADLA